MNLYKADFHIHTVLSPCAALDMSPRNIVAKAKEAGIKIIGITDHNSTLNCIPVKEVANQEEVFVLFGAEITTREEVHCLVFFETLEILETFQNYIDENIHKIVNNPDIFGYQPVVDSNDNILKMVEWWLPASVNKSITEICEKVNSLGGIFIPAHIDRPSNSIHSQLGFIPPELTFDALEISPNISKEKTLKKYVLEHKYAIIRGSDAHFLHQIGEVCTNIWLKKVNFEAIKEALKLAVDISISPL